MLVSILPHAKSGHEASDQMLSGLLTRLLVTNRVHESVLTDLITQLPETKTDSPRWVGWFL